MSLPGTGRRRSGGLADYLPGRRWGAFAVALAVLAAPCTEASDRRQPRPDLSEVSAPPLSSGSPCPSVAPHGAQGGGEPREAQGEGGGLIAFWSDSPWPSLWSVRPDGSHRRRILRTHQNAKRPTLSSDGKWIAFDGTPPGKPPLSEFNIQVVRVDGTGMRTLAASHEWELDAQWSPDSHRLSFSRMPPGADFLHSWVWTVGLDGTHLQRLGRGSMARWSPDGKKLVIEAPTPDTEGDLFVINANGGGRHPLLATPDLEAPAAWSPNGRRIIFHAFRPGRGRRRVRHGCRRIAREQIDVRLGPEHRGGVVAGWLEDPLRERPDRTLAALRDGCRRHPSAKHLAKPLQRV
jgi:hypothetical protein